MIAVCSMFKDSQVFHDYKIDQVDKYFEQMKKQSFGFNNIHFHCIEGGSKDNTYDTLAKYKAANSNISLYKDELPSTPVASVVAQSRFNTLSRVANQLLSHVEFDKYSHILWIESDLKIQNDLLDRLLTCHNKLGAGSHIIAPITLLGTEERCNFYDTWGFRLLDGSLVSPSNYPTGTKQVKSVGCCALIDSSLFRRGLRFGDQCFLSLCEQAILLGAKIYADFDTKIYHPSQRCVASRWIDYRI